MNPCLHTMAISEAAIRDRPLTGQRARTLILALALVAATLASLSCAHAAGSYHATRIPNPAPLIFGEGSFRGWAVNDAGEVVGHTQPGVTNAVSWSSVSGTRRIGVDAGAFAIAENGLVAGYVRTPEGFQPALWNSPLGFPQLLSDLYSDVPTPGFAWAVNSDGWVVAAGNDGTNSPNLLLRPGLPALTLPGTGGIPPGMITDTGLVAGSYTTDLETGAGSAFLWSEATGAHSFALTPGGYTNARGINDAGLIVGSTGLIQDANTREGFLYDGLNGQRLQTWSGFSPESLNNAGHAVGQLTVGPLTSPLYITPALWDGANLVDLRARVLGGLGVYTLTSAWDINNHGQILALGGNLSGVPGFPALATFLLTECARCGQIRPNPNPASRTLDIEADWEQAYNDEHYDNRGILRFYTRVENRFGAVLNNPGELRVIGPDGHLVSNGKLNVGTTGSLFVSGKLDTGGSEGVSNSGTVTIAQGAEVFLGANEWLNFAGSHFAHNGGHIRNLRLFTLVDADFSQGASANFANEAGSVFRLYSAEAVLGGEFENSGTFFMGADPIDSPLRGSLVSLGGVFSNRGGEVTINAGSVMAGSGTYFQDAGATTVNGWLAVADMIFDGGVVRGAGLLSGNAVFGTETSVTGIHQGNSPGTLTFDGNVDLVNAEIELEIASYRRFDRLVVNGTLNVGQVTVRVVPVEGYTPDLNDSFDWLQAAFVVGDPLHYDFSALSPAGWFAQGDLGDGAPIGLWHADAEALAPNPNPAGELLLVDAGALRYNEFAYENAGAIEIAGALANLPGAVLEQQPGAGLTVLTGGRLSNRGTLDGTGSLTNHGDLVNYADGLISLSGNFFLGEGVFENRGRFDNAGTLERPGFGETIVNRGEFRVGGTLMNTNGTLFNTALDANGVSLVYDEFGELLPNAIAPPRFVVESSGAVTGGYVYQQIGFRETETTVDGLLQADFIYLGGVLNGHGTLRGRVNLNGALVEPGSSIGTLTVDGDLSAGSAQFIIEIASLTDFDRLVVSGDATFSGGWFQFRFLDDFLPANGQSFEWLTAGGTISGLDTFNYWDLASETLGVLANSNGYVAPHLAGLTIDFSTGQLRIGAPVPLPGGLLLLASGAALLAMRRRARGSAQDTR